MGNKRDRDERQQFIEKVHRDEVRAQGNAGCDAIAHGVKTEKAGKVFLMLHILKRVENGNGPEEADQCEEDNTEPVQLQGKGKVFCEEEQCQRAGWPLQQQRENHKGSEQYSAPREAIPHLSRAERKKRNTDACQQRYQHRQNQQFDIHRQFPHIREEVTLSTRERNGCGKIVKAARAASITRGMSIQAFGSFLAREA